MKLALAIAMALTLAITANTVHANTDQIFKEKSSFCSYLRPTNRQVGCVDYWKYRLLDGMTRDNALRACNLGCARYTYRDGYHCRLGCTTGKDVDE